MNDIGTIKNDIKDDTWHLPEGQMARHELLTIASIAADPSWVCERYDVVISILLHAMFSILLASRNSTVSNTIPQRTLGKPIRATSRATSRITFAALHSRSLAITSVDLHDLDKHTHLSLGI